jgi:hypothetical protein
VRLLVLYLCGFAEALLEMAEWEGQGQGEEHVGKKIRMAR